MPLTPGAALIRERIAARRRELAQEAPEAVDLAALALEQLHERLWGDAAALAGDRTPRYRRAQLAGERALPLEDLAYLCLYAPEEAAAGLTQLAVAAGYELRRMPSAARTVPDANADVLRAFGEFEALLQEALSDGVLTPSERQELTYALNGLVDRLRELAPAIREAGS